jgi:glycosyltransferase involved in cell wall biosynthesis
MLNLIWRIKPDVVLSTLGYVVTASLASIFSPKSVIFASRFGNTISSFFQEIKKNSQFKYYLQYLANKLVIYLSDIIIVQSNHMLDDILKTFSLKEKSMKKIVKINNPISVDNINLNAKTKAIPGNLEKIFNNNFVFISVGRLDYRKNYESLIKAFKAVNELHHNSRLVILGEGNYRDALEELLVELDIVDFVSLIGFIDSPESIVSHADFFVSSSLYEGVSNSLLESLALGVPVIATDCPSGIGEIVTNGENGYLVSMKGDIVKNLSERMSFVIKDNKKLDPKRINKKIREGFDSKVVIKEYEDVLNQLLN